MAFMGFKAFMGFQTCRSILVAFFVEILGAFKYAMLMISQ